MKQGTLSTEVRYSGEVHMYVEANGGRIEVCEHNSGTKALWNAIARAILGQDIRSSVPKYIDIVFPGTGTSLLFRRLPFSNAVMGDLAEKNKTTSDTRTSVRLSAVLMNEYKTQSSAMGTLQLRMLNSNNEVLAVIESPSALSDIYTSVVPGVDAVIEWTMSFSDITPEAPSANNSNSSGRV